MAESKLENFKTILRQIADSLEAGGEDATAVETIRAQLEKSDDALDEFVESNTLWRHALNS
jgi:hypothetical protein